MLHAESCVLYVCALNFSNLSPVRKYPSQFNLISVASAQYEAGAAVAWQFSRSLILKLRIQIAFI